MSAHWRSSIHMPRWASRLLLRITDVRVQRLREISREDAEAEGCWRTPDGAGHYSIEPPEFREVWDHFNAKPVRIGDSVRRDSWDANPWVWAISFERVRP